MALTAPTGLSEVQKLRMKENHPIFDDAGGIPDAIAALTDITTLISELEGAGQAREDLIFEAATELTIASGIITCTQGVHTVDTESDAASDDLDTISGVAVNELVLLKAEDAARTVVLKHGTGNIYCPGASDISLAEATDWALLVGDGTNVIVLASSTLAGIPDGALSSNVALKDGTFTSTEQTATGSSQNVAHGLGYTPNTVIITVTEGHDGASGAGTQFPDVAEGTHDSTNVVVTVTAGAKFKVIAF